MTRPVVMSGARKPRVLHIQKVSGIAGSENHLLILLPALRERGIDAEMLTLVPMRGGADGFIGRMTTAGVPSFAMSIRRNFDPWLVARLTRFMRERAYDIVHTHLVHADLYGALAARLARIPQLVSSRHNDDPFRASEPMQSIVRFNSRMFDRVICISSHMESFCSSTEGIAPARLATIRYGCQAGSTASFAQVRPVGLPDLHAPVVGMVARLTEQKGHDTLLSAMRRVVTTLPNAQLVLVGDGPIRASLEQKTRDLQLSSNVHFLGWREDAPALMHHFDVFVHPSRWEGFGLVFLEAMAASRPVVATRVGAIPEIVVDGETGLLVDANDADGLASALLRLLQDPALAERMGAAGRARLEREFTVNVMADRTVELYRTLSTEVTRKQSA